MLRPALMALLIFVLSVAALAAEPAKPETPAPPDAAVVYKGKPRTSAWLDAQYAKFKDKLAKIGGEWRDCGRGIAERMTVGPGVPDRGTEIRAAPDGAQVLSVLPSRGILARQPFIPAVPAAFCPAQPEILFEIAMADVSKWVDGAPLAPFVYHYADEVRLDMTPAEAWEAAQKFHDRHEAQPPAIWLVYVGPFAYTATDLSRRTIPGWKPYLPATKDEFREAIAAGLELTDHVLEKKTVRPSTESDGKPRIVIKVVAKPVP